MTQIHPLIPKWTRWGALEKAHRADTRHLYDWSLKARPSQREPTGDWRIWLILAGRGFGKTRTGAETIRAWIESRKAKRICLLGASYGEARQVMLEGESGLLSVFPKGSGPVYRKKENQLIWPNGAKAWLYSAQVYEQLRGPQFDAAWVDELGKFPYAQESWDQLMLGLRLGQNPRVIVTTTPRSIPLLTHLLERPDSVCTRGSTFENADHLAPSFLKDVKARYGGTRFGAQELEGLMLPTSSEAALWREDMIVHGSSPPPEAFKRLVVAVDPAVTYHDDSCETGILVAGMSTEGVAYVIEDLSGRLSPVDWGKRAIAAYHKYQANALIAEINNGGDLVQSLMTSLDKAVAYTGVRASRGKYIRAEPIAALYAQKRVIHTQRFPELESQMLSYTPGSPLSPDRLDALVWALTDLMLTHDSPLVQMSPVIWKGGAP